MKSTILLLAAFGFLVAASASAQSPEPRADGLRPNDAPRTKRERDLGLEGKPRGQREQPAPDDDGYSTEEPDDEDSDLGAALEGAQPSVPRPR